MTRGEPLFSPAGAGASAGTETDLDGRRAKGERRRRVIVDAARRVVARDGVPAVSHRNIAREAGIPPASIAYYFGSIDELLVAALLDSVEVLVAELNRLQDEIEDPADWPRVIAELLAAMVRDGRERAIAEYELYLLAARRPALRPAARRWIEATAGFVAPDGDPAAARALLAAIDGLLVQALIADEPPTADDLELTLRRLV